MKIKRLIIFSALIAVIVASCRKDNKNMDPVDTGIPAAPPKAYAITEDFESGVKTGYDAGDVTTAVGAWNMDGALLGSDPNDTKDGKKSVRIQGTTGNTLRNGMITMDFDIKHLGSISIKAALSNFSDKAKGPTATLKGHWELQLSADHGKTFTKVGSTHDCDTALTITKVVFTDTLTKRFRIVNTSDLNGTSKVRINVDDIEFDGTGDPGFTVGTPDTSPVDTTGTSKPTSGRLVVVGADAPPAMGDNSNLLFGNPSNAQTSTVMGDNYLIDQGYYVESYNATRGEPNWVSWHLDPSNTTNATGRLDNFAAWAGLPTGFYAVQSNSYSGSGFDRGHNCPSADRTSSTAANSATFLMTNMIPQAPQNNQQTWNNLEGYLRAQTLEGNEVYIIMGSYGKGGIGSASPTAVETINGGKVTVPSNVWKIAVIIPAGNGDLARVSSTTRVIAVNTPNINTISTDWTKYIVTVRDIEKATGYNILSALPQNIQDQIEVGKDTGI
jgi:endonuclease G